MTAKTGLGRLSQIRKLRELSWHENMEHKPGIYLLRGMKDGNVKYVGYSPTDFREFMLIKESELVDRYFLFYNHRDADNGDHAFEIACMFYQQCTKTLKHCQYQDSSDRSSQDYQVHSCKI